MSLDVDALKKIVKLSLSIPSEAIGCYECLDEIDCYAETALDGKPIPEALRLVTDHLKDCPECREEYEALLVALRHLEKSSVDGA
ncbi:hypothetical protein HYR54_08495 [Candidatus Acetothermia bacterium]|nr:hypothetical protein [Candidatus Acetothermia bacterium]MBI3459378.1 hypothetical protein [Candidatus Acetothermia bacterium]